MPYSASIEDLILHSLHTSIKSSAKLQGQAPVVFSPYANLCS
jgi:hypothetical protein